MDRKLLSSKNMNWQTPQDFLDLVRKVGPITYDPCTTSANPTGAKWITYPLQADGLTVSWRDITRWEEGVTFVNPPYGRALAAWSKKILEEALEGCEIVCLVPARTDTAWFQPLLQDCSEGLFWSGRIRFVDPETGKQGDAAMFPSFVGYFGDRAESFVRAFRGKGIFVDSARR